MGILIVPHTNLYEYFDLNNKFPVDYIYSSSPAKVGRNNKLFNIYFLLF